MVVGWEDCGAVLFVQRGGAHARPVGIKCGKLASRRRNRYNALKGDTEKICIMWSQSLGV